MGDHFSALRQVCGGVAAKPLTEGAPALQARSGLIPLTLPALGVGIYELSAS